MTVLNEVDLEERTAAVRDLEGVFGDLIVQFRTVLQRNAEAVSPGMLPGTYKVFTQIVRLAPTTISTLAESLVADKGQISRTVGELEKLGLIQRTPDPNDGRSSLLTATAEGLEKLDRARAPQEGRLLGVLEEWSLADIRQLTTLLGALTAGDTPGR